MIVRSFIDVNVKTTKFISLIDDRYRFVSTFHPWKSQVSWGSSMGSAICWTIYFWCHRC